jgi:hypothetical protein
MAGSTFASPGYRPLLFDLQADPAELRNLADDPALLAVRVEMAEKLLAWRSRHLDRRPTPPEAAGPAPAPSRRHNRGLGC